MERSTAQGARYHVHECAGGRGSGHLVEGASDFHDAAILFAENWPGDAAGEMSVIVRACDTGEEQCFVVDLAAGDAEPC